MFFQQPPMLHLMQILRNFRFLWEGKNHVRTGIQLPTEAGETEQPYVADPFSIRSVRINIGPTGESELESLIDSHVLTLSRRSLTFTENGKDLSVEYHALVFPGEFPHNDSGRPATMARKGMTRKQAFNLLLYMYVSNRNGHEAPVPVDEAIFTIKNEMEIPDDFMPPHMMEMVEGRKIVDPESIARELNDIPLSVSGKHLYAVVREGVPGILGIDSLLCSQFDGDAKKFLVSLKESLLIDFSDLEQSAAYDPFTLSRMLKQIIFLHSRGRIVDLGGSAYDDRKSEILVRNGIAVLSDGMVALRPGISHEELETIRKNSLGEAAKLASAWLCGLLSSDE